MEKVYIVKHSIAYESDNILKIFNNVHLANEFCRSKAFDLSQRVYSSGIIMKESFSSEFAKLHVGYNTFYVESWDVNES